MLLQNPQEETVPQSCRIYLRIDREQRKIRRD